MKISLYKVDLIGGLILFFLLLQNIFFRYFSFSGANYWDEAIFIVLIIFAIVNLRTNKTILLGTENTKIVLYTLGIVFIGLCGNLVFSYAQSANAVVRDIVNFMKFPMTFVCMRTLGFDKRLADRINEGALKLLKLLVAIIFVFGIVSLFKDIGLSQMTYRYGIRPYQFLFIHPTYIVIFEIFVLAVLEAYSSSNVWIDSMISITIILSMRTKGIAIVAVYIFLKYAGGWMKRFKFLYWIGAVVVVVASGYSKLMEYASWTTSPRETLYKGALQLMCDCFPLGSGFATFASHLSGKYYSKVYDFIWIADAWENGAATDVLGDAGFPYYLGQFGFIGTILFIIVLWNIGKACKGERKSFNLGVFVLLAYILIALTSEAFLVNDGTQIGIILAVTAYAAVHGKNHRNY